MPAAGMHLSSDASELHLAVYVGVRVSKQQVNDWSSWAHSALSKTHAEHATGQQAEAFDHLRKHSLYVYIHANIHTSRHKYIYIYICIYIYTHAHKSNTEAVGGAGTKFS